MIQAQKPLLDMYIIESVIIANSQTIAVGDAVKINTSNPNSVNGAANTTGIILGTVLNIKNGPASGSTYLQKNTVTVAADNEMVGKISVDILASNNLTTMVADLDDTAGTTTNSQYFGYFNMAPGSNSQLDESSYSASAEKQFLSYGLVPGSTNQVMGVWTKIAQA